mgnify:CR=1 FL=1
MNLVLALTLILGADMYDATFDGANQAYRSGNYAAAVTQYEQLVTAQVENPVLFFNLGNAHNAAGSVGKAIAMYERALQLDPNMEAAKHNIDTLLKNTLADERPAPPASPPPPPRPKEASAPSRRAPAAPRETEAVRRKLAEYVFYPEQARQLGQEGTVELFVELAGDGRVEDVRVVVSSGFPLLDNAAVKGFYAVGRLPGKSGVWHYTFRLE